MGTMAARVGTLVSVLLLSGCFVEADEEDAACANGATQVIPCGTFGFGEQTQLCVGFQWKNDGVCIDESECVVGDTRARTCGLNDRGVGSQTCTAGRWKDTAGCTDPDTCVDDTEDSVACGIQDQGMLARVCVLGAFEDDGECEQVWECDTGETQTQACGFNGNGMQTRGCDDNSQWEDTFGLCEQNDTCENGDVIRAICPNETALNGVKVRERLCEDGMWEEFGPCIEPDECVSGAVDSVGCGDDSTGYQPRRCEEGEWVFSAPCQQTAQHILAGPHSMIVLTALPESSSQPRMFGENRFGTLAMPNRPESAILFPRISLAPTPRQSGVGPAGRFASSSTHACAINLQNDLYCWGANDDGQLGELPSSSSDDAEPRLVPIADAGTKVVEVATGEGFTCARTSTNALYCWGRNDESQLGVAGPSTSVPTRVGNGKTVVGITAGEAHACFRTPDNDVFCWGRNTSRQASPNAVDAVAAPTKNPSLSEYPGFVGIIRRATVVSVVAGANHTLVLWDKTGSLFVKPARALIGVGANNAGQLGQPIAANPFLAQAAVLDRQDIEKNKRGLYAVSASGDVTCVEQAFGGPRVRCAGANSGGALAAAAAAMLPTLTAAPADLDPDGEGIAEVVLGRAHLCVRLAVSQRVRCRGANDAGQLGDGTTNARDVSGYVLHQTNAP